MGECHLTMALRSERLDLAEPSVLRHAAFADRNGSWIESNSQLGNSKPNLDRGDVVPCQMRPTIAARGKRRAMTFRTRVIPPLGIRQTAWPRLKGSNFSPGYASHARRVSVTCGKTCAAQRRGTSSEPLSLEFQASIW